MADDVKDDDLVTAWHNFYDYRPAEGQAIPMRAPSLKDATDRVTLEGLRRVLTHDRAHRPS